MLLLQITPKGPGGVTDCAEQLQRCWQEGGARCQTLQVDETSPPSSVIDRLAAEPAVVILLHLSAYGYARRGLCGWLVADMRRMIRSRPDIALVTYFHEISADGPPWRSAWWTRGEQQRIATNLGNLSDAAWTNTPLNRDWLASRLAPSKPISCSPVVSNVGEIGNPKPASQRSRQAVLFGSFTSRRRCLETPSLWTDLHRLGIERLTEIGPGETAGPSGLPIDFMGALPAPEVSKILADTCYGLIQYPPRLFGKSGVFAAYAAHGCIPLLVDRSAAGDPAEGRFYLQLRDEPPPPSELDRIAAAAHAWYQPHRLGQQAAELKNMLLSGYRAVRR